MFRLSGLVINHYFSASELCFFFYCGALSFFWCLRGGYGLPTRPQWEPTACLRPHNLVHVPTPAYAPKGNAYIHNDQCQPPDKSFCLLKNLCSSDEGL